MPHADSSLIPQSIHSKSEFWEHVYLQLGALLLGQRIWVSNLANASALLYHSLLAFPDHFGPEQKAVNWCGFYLNSTLFPNPGVMGNGTASSSVDDGDRLLLGPFCGKPACQFINTSPAKARGVCADAYLQRQTVLVPDVELYPGHIACDGNTKSEIVCPLLLRRDGETVDILGVLDLDCLAIAGFSDEDKIGLEKIVELVVNSCDW